MISKHAMTAAAGLMGLTVLVHVLAGGPENYAPLRGSDLPPVVRSVLSVVWHMATLVMALFSIALWHLRGVKNAALFGVVFWVLICFAALFLAYGAGDLGNLWQMPQWLAFLLIAGLMRLGAVR